QQCVAGSIKAQRRVVAHGGPFPIEMRAAVYHLWKAGFFQPVLRENEFDVVVKASTYEIVQLRAAKRQANKTGADGLARQQLDVPGAEGMAYTLDDCCIVSGHITQLIDKVHYYWLAMLT